VEVRSEGKENTPIYSSRAIREAESKPRRSAGGRLTQDLSDRMFAFAAEGLGLVACVMQNRMAKYSLRHLSRNQRVLRRDQVSLSRRTRGNLPC
jgi:hypothetical protein